MDDVASLLDYSIATRGYIIRASDKTNYIDLSQIDFDVLRGRFDKGRRAAEAQKLRSQIAQKLTRMVRLNRTRIDFLQEFQNDRGLQLRGVEHRDVIRQVDRIRSEVVRRGGEFQSSCQRRSWSSLTC
jgi:hypothetical protein